VQDYLLNCWEETPQVAHILNEDIVAVSWLQSSGMVVIFTCYVRSGDVMGCVILGRSIITQPHGHFSAEVMLCLTRCVFESVAKKFIHWHCDLFNSFSPRVSLLLVVKMSLNPS